MVARFLVVEDHAPLAEALASAAACLGLIHVAKTVASGVALLAERRDWAAFVVDVVLPDGNGLDVLAEARDMDLDAPALVLTALHDPATINRACALRSRFLVKPADPLSILSFLSEATTRIAGNAGVDAREWGRRYGLTQTELAILAAAATGSPRDQVAFERGISTRTMKKHVNNLLRKTGDESLLAAVARLLRDR